MAAAHEYWHPRVCELVSSVHNFHPVWVLGAVYPELGVALTPGVLVDVVTGLEDLHGRFPPGPSRAPIAPRRVDLMISDVAIAAADGDGDGETVLRCWAHGQHSWGEEPDLEVVLSVRGVARFVASVRDVESQRETPCPYCGLPLTGDAHICPRANGYRR